MDLCIIMLAHYCIFFYNLVTLPKWGCSLYLLHDAGQGCDAPYFLEMNEADLGRSCKH